MRLLKCNTCGEKFPKSELIYIGENRKVCQSCHNDSRDYRILIDNMCKLYGVSRPDGLWLSKIKAYKSEGMTYAQIWYVMDYIVRIVGKKPDEFTIMAVPSYFNSTKKLYDTKHRFETSLGDMTKPKENQKIKIADVNIIKPKIHNTRIVNIGEL